MPAALSNAEIADRLNSLAQLLSAQKENPFKVKAYRRAAKTIKALSESVDQLVRSDADLTEYSGIGKAISGAVREIVMSGTLGQLDKLRAEVSPELAAISEHPRLDPKRVLRIYKKLKISSIAELKEKLASGAVADKLGARMDQHVRQALTEIHEMLLYDADRVAAAVEEFLLTKCGVRRAEIAGDCRRRVEVVGEISCLIETGNFPAVQSKLERYGGKAELLSSGDKSALYKLASGILLRIETAKKEKWGAALIAATGSQDHLRKLKAAGSDLDALFKSKDSYATEAAVYRKLSLSFIEPELREGRNEVELAGHGKLPKLVAAKDIRGELHAHSTSSDGANSIEAMAAAAAREGVRIHRDYRSLPYVSVHSRFGLGKTEQTQRILRAMDNRYFTILGHATGRLLLKRPGYEIEMERVVEHAKQNGCFFEINSSPDRLDLSAPNARLAREAGVKIAISTDAHSIRELDDLKCGIDQARRAALEKGSVLNCLSWPELQRIIKR